MTGPVAVPAPQGVTLEWVNASWRELRVPARGYHAWTPAKGRWSLTSLFVRAPLDTPGTLIVTDNSYPFREHLRIPVAVLTQAWRSFFEPIALVGATDLDFEIEERLSRLFQPLVEHSFDLNAEGTARDGIRVEWSVTNEEVPPQIHHPELPVYLVGVSYTPVHATVDERRRDHGWTEAKVRAMVAGLQWSGCAAGEDEYPGSCPACKVKRPGPHLPSCSLASYLAAVSR